MEYFKKLMQMFRLDDDMDDVCEFCEGAGRVEIEGEVKKCPECGVEDFTGATTQER